MNIRRPASTFAFAALLAAGGALPAFEGAVHPAHAAGLPPLPGSMRHIVSLPGSVLPDLRSARRLSMLPSGQQMSVEVSMKLRNQSALTQLLHDVYDRKSPMYRHFLTTAEFRAAFAPTAQQERSVESWLNGQGLRVTQRYSNGMTIGVRGSAVQIERAFATHEYAFKRGSDSFFANTVPAHVPAAIAATVQGVSGLSSTGRTAWDSTHLVPDGSHLPSPSKDLSPVTPEDIASLYDLNPFYKQGTTGGNQTVALVEMADYQDANISAFDSQFKITPGTVSRVAVNDGTGQGATLNDGENECELDIEVVQSVAPAANILVYEAPGNSQFASFVAIWSQMVSDDKAQVISSSWSLPEWDWEPSAMWAVHAAIEEAAVQGQTVYSSTKDHGAYADVQHPNNLSVGYPGSDPWATGVGGTMIVQDSQGNLSEAAWSDPSDKKERVGGGGGLSTVWARPAYQAGPGVQESYSNGARQVPDVSALAGYPYYQIYTVDKGGHPGQWFAMSGTSASTPLWAGIQLLINQLATGRLGFMNPTFYALPQHSFQYPAFNDIVTGDNLYYKAGPGWDFASGLGTPDVTSLANDIGSMGVVQYQPSSAIFAIDGATAAVKSGSKLKAVQSVKRNQSVYLAGVISVYRLASSTAANWKFALLNKSGKSVLSRSAKTTLSTSDAGKSGVYYVKVKVPKSLKKGTYYVFVEVLIGDQDEYESAKVTVK